MLIKAPKDRAFINASTISAAAERLKHHQTKSGPVMSRLREWIEEQFEEKKVEPNGRDQRAP